MSDEGAPPASAAAINEAGYWCLNRAEELAHQSTTDGAPLVLAVVGLAQVVQAVGFQVVDAIWRLQVRS